MSDEVQVPFDAGVKDTATLLLAAAEDLGLDPSVVRTAEGAFVVPKEVHERAFRKEEPEPEKEEPQEEKASHSKWSRRKKSESEEG